MTSSLITLFAALAGFGAGWLHFQNLRRLAAHIIAGNRSAIAAQALRLIGLAVFLYLCAKAGALPLLAAAAGILVGRGAVMRAVRLETRREAP